MHLQFSWYLDDMHGVSRVILSALSVGRLGRATVLAACDTKPCYDAVRPSPLYGCMQSTLFTTTVPSSLDAIVSVKEHKGEP